MSWRNRLVPAKWRGINFHTDSKELTGGKRLVVHEYPGRNKPFTEELGNKPRSYSIVGYLIGADYDLERDRFLSALEQSGPGQLSHPSYGDIHCFVASHRFSESKDEGGYLSFSVNFIEAGETPRWGASPNTGVQVISLADAFRAASLQAHAETYITSGVDLIRENAAEGVKGSLAALLDAGVLTKDDSVFENIQSALTKGLSWIAVNPVEALDIAFSGYKAAAYKDPLRIATVADKVLSVSMPTYDPRTGTRIKQAINLVSTHNSLNAVALATRAITLSREQFETVDDAVLARSKYYAHSQKWITAISKQDIAVKHRQSIAAASELAAAVSRDVKERSVNLTRLASYDAKTSMPAIKAAYDYYDSPSRAEEITRRLGAAYPAALPLVGRVLAS